MGFWDVLIIPIYATAEKLELNAGLESRVGWTKEVAVKSVS